MKKKTEQNAAGAPQMGKTAGAGAAGFLKKNWKWLVPVACVAVLGGVWLLKPKADKPAIYIIRLSGFLKLMHGRNQFL